MNVRLRRYEAADLCAFEALLADAAVMRFVGEGTPLSPEAAAALGAKALAVTQTDPSFFVRVVEEDGEYAGHAELKRRPGRPEHELVYLLQRKRWGRALGGRVVDLLLEEARRREIAFVIATVVPENAASIAILRRRGFTPDSRLTALLGAQAYSLTLREKHGLPDGYTDVPAGKLANVATYLEMLQPPPPRADPAGLRCTLERVEEPELGWYRELFRRVGGAYLWSSRLILDDAALRRALADPRDEVYAARDAGGADAALLELDFRRPGECELLYFGVVESALGKGLGRWLMNRAIERAWSQPIRRFTVHTCTLDHPSALPFYIRSGFVPYKRAVEIYDDPRQLGLLPRELAPEVPLL